MWVLRQCVSIKQNETIQHVQYLGDDGEVGEVGEYFGEAGVINAGAIGVLVSHFSIKYTTLTHMLRIEGKKER